MNGTYLARIAQRARARPGSFLFQGVVGMILMWELIVSSICLFGFWGSVKNAKIVRFEI